MNQSSIESLKKSNDEKEETVATEEHGLAPSKSDPGIQIEKSDFYDDIHSQESLDEPTKHFKKLKAKIKLQSHKKYRGDLERQREEAEQAAIQAIEVKDKYGRVMEKKHPLL